MAANARMNILDWVLEKDAWKDVMWIVELGTRSTEEPASKTGVFYRNPRADTSRLVVLLGTQLATIHKCPEERRAARPACKNMNSSP